MAKIVSTAISILLLVLVDRAALEWKRMRGAVNQDGTRPDSIQLNEGRPTAGLPGTVSNNIVADNVMGTGRF